MKQQHAHAVSERECHEMRVVTCWCFRTSTHCIGGRLWSPPLSTRYRPENNPIGLTLTGTTTMATATAPCASAEDVVVALNAASLVAHKVGVETRQLLLDLATAFVVSTAADDLPLRKY